ncbi:hypothetical protein RI129_010077 [Pyrocoelia pectoralis]|uniref:Tyr recombinase domain-containing protein n=1 Tax=Pyrocoelia pectoralis TaxID=417401 RepID=A0AAN7V3S1_9COLE
MFSESSDNEDYCNIGTPPELKEAAERAEACLLPEKSRGRYEMALKVYEKWCAERNAKNIASETALMAYFSDMARQKKPSTLWATYSMIRTMLELRKKTDISKYYKLVAFLKRQNVGFKPKKSSIFTRENLEDFLKKAPQEFLPIKVALIVGVSGACRSDELLKMKTTHINILENKICIEIPDTKTYKSRSFMITNTNWIEIVKEFIQVRKDIENERFFVQYRLGKARNQPFGYNSISKFPYNIASFLKLPNAETYTGHAFRRTAATLLVNSGADILQLKRLGGWKSSAVAEGYVDVSVANQTKTANMISLTTLPSSSCSNSNSLSSFVDIRRPDTSQEFRFCSSENSMSETHHQGGPLTISINAYNNSNLTINFNK